MKNVNAAFAAFLAIIANTYIVPMIPFNKFHLPFEIKGWAVSHVIVPLFVGLVYAFIDLLKFSKDVEK